MPHETAPKLTDEQREKIRAIRKRLDEIAPYPHGGSDALVMARWLAAQAQIAYQQEILNRPLSKVSEPLNQDALRRLSAQFAAAHALAQFHNVAPQQADEAASQIHSAWEDGGGIGEWLWEMLGDQAWQEISRLADELREVSQ